MNLETRIKKEITPALKKELGLKNDFQVPRIVKVTLNVGVGKSLKDPNYLSSVEDSFTRIAGQKPVRTKAKKSISSFKIRQGLVVGLKATLRKKRMYDFLEKLFTVTLPRVRDFRGLDLKAIDKQGNLSIGFKEHLPFPEVRSDEIERVHGLEVAITTNAGTHQAGLALFRALGVPFKEKESKK
ncbi:MAG: 50S ribosomal protein L5 [bacterium]|nr:50S ribosomal protein L5 [bacterium]